MLFSNTEVLLYCYIDSCSENIQILKIYVTHVAMC